MRKIICAAAGAVALAVGGLAPAAFAEEVPGEGFIFAESPWDTLDTGPGPGWEPGLEDPSELSTFTGPRSVELTWAEGNPESDLGTSAETTDLGVAVNATDEIVVGYELIDGASPAATAVRVFAQVDDEPIVFAAAPVGDDSGTLVLELPTTGTVGHVGLVYDTSNGGVEGTVRFSDLSVAGESVLFVPPADPTLKQPTCTESGSITIPEGAGYAYEIDGMPVDAGGYARAPGDYVVTAKFTGLVAYTWTLTLTAPTGCQGDDDGTDDGGEDGTDDGTDDGAEDGGSDDGAEDGGAESGTDDGGTDDGGAEAGTDDGSGDDDGSPSPTPSADDCDAYVDSAAWCDPAHGDYDCSEIDDAHTPVQLVDAGTDPFLLDSDDDGVGCEGPDDDGSGDDDGTGDDDGNLPDTGSGAGSTLLWAGIALLVLGGAAALVARHRTRPAG